MIWVQIPLDMDFFLLYMVYSRETSQQLIMTQIMLTGAQKSKAVMRMLVENKQNH